MFPSSLPFPAATLVIGTVIGSLLLLYKFPLLEIMRTKRMDTTKDTKEPEPTAELESNENPKDMNESIEAEKPAPNPNFQLPHGTLLIAISTKDATARIRSYAGGNAKLFDDVLSLDAPIGTNEVRLLFGERESEGVMLEANDVPTGGHETNGDGPALSFTVAALMPDEEMNASSEGPTVLVVSSDIVDELSRPDKNEGEIVDTKEENGKEGMDDKHVKAGDGEVGEDEEALETGSMEAKAEDAKEKESRIDEEDPTLDQATDADERVPLSLERCFRRLADIASVLPGSSLPSNIALVDRSEGSIQAFTIPALDTEGDKGGKGSSPKSENTGDVAREEHAEKTGGSSGVTPHHARVEDALDDAE